MKKGIYITAILLCFTQLFFPACKKTPLKYPACGEGFTLYTPEYKHLGFKKTWSDGSTTRIYRVCPEGMFISLLSLKDYNHYLEFPENSISSEGYVKTTWDQFDATLAPNNGAFDIDSNYTVITSTTNEALFFEIETRDLVWEKPAFLMLEFNLFNTNDCKYCNHSVALDSLTIIRFNPNTMEVLGEVKNPQVFLNPNYAFNSPAYKNKIGIVSGDIMEPGCYTLAARRK
ncbi:MAG: hypothetical protein JNL57_01265 [Bacteroidetes bacterium]|nr:hypothetical protein [Bacteroidota bacterium]